MSGGWGSTSAPNNGRWGTPANAAAQGSGGWGSAGGDRGGAADDDLWQCTRDTEQLDAEAQLEQVSMLT